MALSLDSVARGLFRGASYGAKVRLPHALVTALLFGKGTIRSKAAAVALATWTHARNLGLFVALYKAALWLVDRAGGGGGMEIAAAGFVGGFLVFGRETAVNSQINMYVLARVIVGAARLAVSKGWIPVRVPENVYGIYAGVVWAAVMVLFEFQPEVLQRSLRQSMEYLYHEQERR